jgi:cellulose synthase (UDP-forming)
MQSSLTRPDPPTRIIRALVLCVTAFFSVQLISLYLSWPKQLVLGGVSILLGLVANRLSTSRLVTLGLMFTSMTATFRYGWWRISLVADFFSDESNSRFSLDSVFLLILLSAEAYTIVIMVLGYMQTAWPLHRPPISLPNDAALWPHVDVLLPTYNEPLSLVRYTALAARNMDYPPDKLHVYILDDGSREEFREFATAAGIGYVTRVEHKHAKAGNINHALSTMNSPYVTIFDCDHVPTRSFLQVTLGWMLVDPLLAMLQTPHHFYSPDPFERNLLQYKTIPSEAELFYGIVQDGNDFWNATFFCGSCALIRRSALDVVGGIAVETVTEDAHTSLRMQKHGYNTAYINIPQAAGLATETLAAHVGQRIRWARGMIQILRTDNPLFARGMKFTQRLCYFNAMIHFMYAVPRLVFLLAPLVYLLLGRTIIPGYWVAILAYAVPHLILSNLTNSRIQGRHRHSFWNEIYETVLAPYILAPTLLALINPKLGSFNVTDKGSTLSETQFDRKIATPTKWLLLLNILGILAAPYRLIHQDPYHPGTVIMNLVWVMLNIVILGVAAAVAHEQKQRRSSVRIEARIPIRIDLADGLQVHAVTIDMSVGGASILLLDDTPLAIGERFRVVFPEHAGEEKIGAYVVGSQDREIRLAFSVPTIEEQETLTRALYSRADAWLVPTDSREVDRPLISLIRVIRLSRHGLYQVCRSLFPHKPQSKKAYVAPRVAALFFVCMLASCAQALGLGAWNPSQDRQTSQSLPAAIPGEEHSALSAAIDTETPFPVDSDSSTFQKLSLKDMGVPKAIELRGPHSYDSVRFILSHALVPRHALLRLVYNFDPRLDKLSASLKVSLNGTTLVTLLPSATSQLSQGFADFEIPVPQDQLVRSNSFTFEFIGGGAMQQEDLARTQILARISASSSLEVSGDRLVWQNDLGQLPMPLFDSDLQSLTTIPFVFLTPPSPKMLQAAGIVASWLGLQAGPKPVRFAVSIGQIPVGNVIVFSDNPSTLLRSLQIHSGTDRLLALRVNPSDPLGSALVLAGEDDERLLTIAQTLALTRKATVTAAAQGLSLVGESVEIPELTMPDARKEGDAPRWLSIGTAVPFANCQTPEILQSDGSRPIPVYFHVPPDLFYGEKQNIKLHLRYRYDALQVVAGSALRVIINGNLVNEIPLLSGKGITDRDRLIFVPVADIRPFGNTILFNFDFVPANRESAQSQSSTPLSGEILCSSSLDLHGLASWAHMPNLELFANAGFPFTQFADLSQTTVILPTSPSSQEISLYLQLMGHFGAQSGYPALRVTVDGPDAVISKARDYLVLGTIANQPAFKSLNPLLRVTLDSNGVEVKEGVGYLSLVPSIEAAWSHGWATMLRRAETQNLPSNIDGIPDAIVEEIESPSSSDRSIVLIALKQGSSADHFVSTFVERSQSDDINSSVSLLRNSKFVSYPMEGANYYVGNISSYAMMRIWLTQHFLLLLLAVTALGFLVALWTREWLSRRAHERLRLAEHFDNVN